MNPWNIIGWGVVLAVALPLAVVIGATAWEFLAALWRHIATRNTPPRAGQVWMQGDATLRIKRVTEEGRVVMESPGPCGSTSWSDDAAGWRERVHNRRLWLRKEAP